MQTNRLTTATARLMLASVALLAGGTAMSYEQPDYTVIHEQDGIEYRQYDSYLVAETVIRNTDGYRDAGAEGFRRLFAYISGANRNAAEIAMTVPVAAASIDNPGSDTRSGEKIAMTVPVQQAESATGWTMSFALPAAYTLETAPQPVDQRVYIREVPSRLVAVRQFASRWTDRSFVRQEIKLRDALRAADIEPQGRFERAVYNAPFSLPFTRRNEIMVAVNELPAAARDAEILLPRQQLAAQR